MKHYLTALLVSSFLLSACGGGALFRPSLYDDTAVTERQITLHENRYTETLQADEITYSRLADVSYDYERHGDSPLYVALGYAPENKNAALSAKNQANIIKGQLAKLNLTNAIVTTLPVQNSDGSAIIAYDRVVAKGPQNCGKMPGYSAQTGSYQEYGLGCTVKDMMAQQVAYPKDLQGQAAPNARTDANRAATIVNRDIRAGEVSPFVPSYVLSGLAGSTTQ